MEIILEEETNYFKTIVKDAISDLKKGNKAYVFYKEQVDAIKQTYDKEIEVTIDEDEIYCLTNKKNCDNI